MPKPTMSDLAKHSVRGWGAVLTAGIVLTVLALADGPRASTGTAGASTASSATASTGSTACRMQVTAAQLQVRSGPSVDASPLQMLAQGAVVDGTTEVTDGFRRLTANRWAANEFLVPVAGTACS